MSPRPHATALRTSRTSRTGLVALAAALATTALAGAASAKPTLDVAHVLGRDAPWVVGWNEAVVTLDNKDGGAWRGEVIVDPTFDHHAIDRPSVRVPVTLAAGESARLVLPFYLPSGSWGTVMLLEGGREAAQQPLGANTPIETASFIVEIQGASARGARLVEAPAAPATPGTPTPGTLGAPPPPDEDKGLELPKLGASGYLPLPPVSTVQFARESGDPILPDLTVGWSGATTVVVPSDVLSRLQGQPLDALAQWVVSGGTLAVSMVREEDLRSANLARFLGGEARVVGTSGQATSFSGGKLTKGSAITGGDEGDVAPYGLGEVWMLRRDPWSRAPDPQSPRALYDVYARSRLRRANLMSLPFGHPIQWIDDDRVRALLDPNQGFRPALGIAAILVVVYAFLVGPLVFRRARKLGKPLSVLRVTPLLAVILFAVLVGIGRIGKGVKGRVRKLEVVEVAGGAPRGGATTFHAFYVADPSAIELAGAHPIDGVHTVDPLEETVPLDVERSTVVVRNVRSHPWQTVVIEEDGARDLDGTITLEGSGARLTLVNNTKWTLEHVVLHPQDPGIPARSRYFRRIEPGQTVTAREGVAVERRIAPTPIVSGELAADGPAGNEQTKLAYTAIEALVNMWFTYGAGAPLPLETPVATCLVHASSHPESGFAVDDDLIFLRVIGLGGGKGKGEIDNPLEKKGSEEEL